MVGRWIVIALMGIAFVLFIKGNLSYQPDESDKESLGE
jgi:hypothetical protein